MSNMASTADALRASNGANNGANSGDSLRLDGNAAAGLLRELFAFEMTTALGACARCGQTSPLGSLLAYGSHMGLLLRCPGCDHLLLCVTPTPEGYWLDVSGLQVLRIEAACQGTVSA